MNTQHETRVKLTDSRELPAAQAACSTLVGAQACGHTRGPDASMFLRECPGHTQNLPVSLLQKRQKMTARTYNQHKLTRTKEKAQEVSGDRQGRHTAGALRGRRAISFSGRPSQPRDQTVSLMSPALIGWFFTTSTTWEAPFITYFALYSIYIHTYVYMDKRG